MRYLELNDLMKKRQDPWAYIGHCLIISLHQDINQLEDGPGPVDLADALALLRTEVYTELNGDRPDARNQVSLLIDGVAPGGQRRIAEEAEACRLAGSCTYTSINKCLM